MIPRGRVGLEAPASSPSLTQEGHERGVVYPQPYPRSSLEALAPSLPRSLA
jgi:hypothetical protein